jgi:hypothetical protein
MGDGGLINTVSTSFHSILRAHPLALNSSKNNGCLFFTAGVFLRIFSFPKYEADNSLCRTILSRASGQTLLNRSFFPENQ